MKLQRLAFVSLLVASALAPLARAGSQADEPSSYARIARSDAKILNMPDDQATVVAAPAKGALVALYRDLGDWVEVELPGGYAVWVFGRYLTESEEPDVYRVNGNGVNVRPMPSRGVPNYPLGQQLFAGDKVRVIERADPKLPLAEDWVRIWSPPGVHAWIHKASIAPLAEGEVGADLWAKVLADLPPAPARAKLAREASASASTASTNGDSADGKAGGGETERTDAFSQELDKAWKHMEAEETKEVPDWLGVRASFAAAERAAKGGADIAQVRQGLEALALREETSRLRAALQEERRRREDLARREQERVWSQSREKDPLGGVFLVRGALERVGQGESERFLVRFGKDVVAEIECVSGRYDLGLFVGYQVGVKGLELPPAEEDGATRVEVTRLELIGRRP